MTDPLALLEKALRLGGPTHEVADVVAMIKRGEAQMHGNGEGFAITTIRQEPLVRIGYHWLVFGKIEACERLAPGA